MSRSGYTDEFNGWDSVRWRGAVESAIRGARGQSFFRDLLAALNEMPVKRLIANELEKGGEFCALGALGAKQGIDLSKIDPEDSSKVAATFNIADALAREVVFMNDERSYVEAPEERWVRVRNWVEKQIPKEDRE